MIEMENPPYAPNLVESMRSIGYSFDTAVADIVDNSIGAKATEVNIIILAKRLNTSVTILDNGKGMSSDELFRAMQYGSSSPNNARKENDMGRFGLGLKSASLSQCRKLTVVSKVKNKISSYCWDIDYVIKRGGWVIQELETNEIEMLPNIKSLENLEQGTLVIWENLDRINESSVDMNDYLKKLLNILMDHLSLIYHRLIGRNFNLVVNGNNLVPRDPFLENHKQTQLKREQKIIIDGCSVLVKPYILPHINMLNQDDLQKVGGKESLKSDQGFYIYRNKRLIIWGTWFRLAYKNELTKLARVRVDIPNNMDYLWDIDIKKSSATIPEKVKISLYNAVMESCDFSEKVHVYKGKRVNSPDVIRTWNIIEKRREQSVGIELNLENPLVVKFIDTLSSNQKSIFSTLVKTFENNLPIDYIYATVAKNGSDTNIYKSRTEEELLKKITNYIFEFEKIGMDRVTTIQYLKVQEEFAGDAQSIKILDELKG